MYKNLYTLYIKRYRELRRMSQSELAFKIGKSQGFISQIEKNNISRNKSPQLVTLVLIAQALDICPNDIVIFKCNQCHRFNICTRHQQIEEDDVYFKDHLDYYI